MRQKIKCQNEVNGIGDPYGGYCEGKGIDIRWQAGPLGIENQREPNGAFVEGVIESALQRLEFFQTANNGKFACRQNAIAITKLEEALMWLDDRTKERVAREVEGSMEP